MTTRFNLGHISATPAALTAIADAGQTAQEFLARHAAGDWGEVDQHDRRANDRALADGSRILSAYRTSRGERLWVITEAIDDAGVRATTTILLPDEY